MIAIAPNVIPASASDIPASEWDAPRLAVRRFIKRGIDVVLGASLLLLSTLVIPSLAALIWLKDGGSPFYPHERVGMGGSTFRCWKLRTMRRDADAALARHLAACPEAEQEWALTRKLRTDPRILGRLGSFLRRTSLDELPQLWNVVRGEMSLVGPRPVVRDELAHYGSQLGWYLAVRPGITGPWQVGGRSETTYAARVRLDVGYARAPSLRGDLAILVRTLRVPFEQRGAC